MSARQPADASFSSPCLVRGLPPGGGRLFLLSRHWINDHDVRLWDRQITTRENAGIDLTVLYRPGELDEVFAIVENIKADFLDPVGRRRAQQPLELAVLVLRDLDRVGRTVLRQVAEENEVLAGCDLRRQLGIGLLPAVAACGAYLLIAVLFRLIC